MAWAHFRPLDGGRARCGGALSRLAHTFAVPIRDSSTEGDYLAAAARVLDDQRLEFTTRLIGTWQLAIYAGRRIEDRVIFDLCEGFDARLPAANEVAPVRSGAFAAEGSA